MMRNVFMTSVLGFVLLTGTIESHAADWVKSEVDIPNKNVQSNYYDSQSVKFADKKLAWTEKTILTDFGAQYYTKHLSMYPDCQKNISSKGNVTQHQIDLEIQNGKFRTVAKRNYDNAGELLCTDKEMGTEFDTSWIDIPYASPMYYRYNYFAQKYKLGDF